MIKETNRELTQDKQMAVFKNSFKTVTFFIFISIFLSSCKSNLKNEEALLKSISYANEHYIESVKMMRLSSEEYVLGNPKHLDIYKRIQILDKEILEYYNLEDLKAKKSYLNSLKPKIERYLHKDSIEFVCLNLEGSGEKLFDLIARNDLNRMLYMIYKTFESSMIYCSLSIKK